MTGRYLSATAQNTPSKTISAVVITDLKRAPPLVLPIKNRVLEEENTVFFSCFFRCRSCATTAAKLGRRDTQEIDMPSQRLAAAELSGGRVVALASDCKYGFRLAKGNLYCTLINVSENPDPYPERGIHEISLYIIPADSVASELRVIKQ